eukprot:m.337018 g.337018  ORF g.337018 m.337018 type:complete len:287 (-) comp18024_c0_seq1:48-908(-)
MISKTLFSACLLVFVLSVSADKKCRCFTHPQRDNDDLKAENPNINSRERCTPNLTCPRGEEEIKNSDFDVSGAQECGNTCMNCGCGGFRVKEDDCFPSDAMVELAGGVFVPMHAVSSGMNVRVSSGSFSKVFLFSHSDNNTVAEYVSLTLESKKRLQISPGHYLYVNNVLTPARKVQVGDVLSTVDGDSAITSITRDMAKGLFNPHTVQGDIVVNGIVASTYTESFPPKLAHALLSPVAVLYEAYGFSVGRAATHLHKFAFLAPLFGLSSNAGDWDIYDYLRVFFF